MLLLLLLATCIADIREWHPVEWFESALLVGLQTLLLPVLGCGPDQVGAEQRGLGHTATPLTEYI